MKIGLSEKIQKKRAIQNIRFKKNIEWSTSNIKYIKHLFSLELRNGKRKWKILPYVECFHKKKKSQFLRKAFQILNYDSIPSNRKPFPMSKT